MNLDKFFESIASYEDAFGRLKLRQEMYLANCHHCLRMVLRA